MRTSDSNERSVGRTRLITAAAVLGVALAGAAAIVANVGILNAAESSAIGTLSASDSLLPAEQEVIDASADPAAASSAGAGTAVASQTFEVDRAGTATVVKDSQGFHLGDVVANPGWTARPGRSSGSVVVVSFSSGTRTLELVASLSPNGAIDGAVTETSAQVATSSTSTRVDDDHHDDDDDHHDDDGEHRTTEHEGGDDDD